MSEGTKVTIYAAPKVLQDMMEKVMIATVESSIEIEPIEGGSIEDPLILIPGPPGIAQKASASPGIYKWNETLIQASDEFYWWMWWNGEDYELKKRGNVDKVDYSDVARTEVKIGKNLFNPGKIDFSKKYSPGTKSIVGRDSIQVLGPWIPLGANESLAISTDVALPSGAGHTGGYFSGPDEVNAISSFNPVNITGGYKITAPNNPVIKGVRLNAFCQGVSPNNTLIGKYQVERGETVTPFEPFYSNRELVESDIPGYLKADNIPSRSEVDKKIDYERIIEIESFNKLDPAKIDFTRYFSPGEGKIKVRDGAFALGQFIEGIPGAFYTMSTRTGLMPEFHAGYFASEESVNSTGTVSWSGNPVSSTGRFFRFPTNLPTGSGFRVSLPCQGNPPINILIDDFQIEIGEIATPYQPYEGKEQIIPSLIPNQSVVPQGSFDARAWFTFTEGEDKSNLLQEKCPRFLSHWLLKNKNLVVGRTGTSQDARTDESNGSSTHPKANERPPLMHSLNHASLLWDKMTWDNQWYRRYDYPGFFTETGAFATSANQPEWDDSKWREGLTRYSSSANAAISFKIPVDAWQFNFIYRTDSLGVENNTLTVHEGNGVVQYFDETTQSWKEANGINLSMRESPQVPREIQVPSPGTGNINTFNFATKSNTTYQKRLKMRCKGGVMDSRHFSKTITIQAQSPGRLMYWGVEWSPREFMISLISASRGSHGTDAASPQGLPRFADNEVWGFKPDLLFFELPIHNDGASSPVELSAGYCERLTNNYVFNPDYELSMVRRSQDLNGYVPEMIMHTSIICWGFGGINNDGSLKLGKQGDGSMMTSLDKFNQAFNWVITNHPEVGIVNVTQRWVQAGVAIFGDMRKATTGSGKTGMTFTNENSHPNDTGSKIIAKALSGLFNFI